MTTRRILTTRTDLSAADVAQAMFSRWRQENLFRFMRPRDLDAMDSYAKVPDDAARLVPNPAKAKVRQELAGARADRDDVTVRTIRCETRIRPGLGPPSPPHLPGCVGTQATALLPFTPCG